MTTPQPMPVQSPQQQGVLLDIVRRTFGWNHVALLAAGMRGPNRVAVQFATQQGTAYLIGTAVLDNIVWGTTTAATSADVHHIDLVDRMSSADLDFMRKALDDIDD